MGSDASPLTPAEIDATPLVGWYEARGVPRSTAFRLVKLAGLELGRMKVPGTRAPVSALTAEQVAILDRLADRLQDGATLPQLEAELTAAMVPVELSQVEPVPDGLSPSATPIDADALLARLEAGERAIRSGLPLTTSEVAWLLLARPGGDRVTRAGVEAVRHGRNIWQLRRSEPG